MKDQLNFEEIIADATCAAVAESRRLAMAGNPSPMRLYYRNHELLLTANPRPEGFTDSGKVLPASIDYASISRWIRGHADTLPIMGFTYF